jgi:uncharacterized protein (DUF58 family)
VVKEMFEETTLACHLLVDASESMAFGSLAWTKFDYARWCAAALAHLVIGERDTSGLVLFDDRERTKVPPASGERQKHAIWARSRPRNPRARPAWATCSSGSRVAAQARHRGRVFSDFFDESPPVVEGLRRLVHDGHEPILVQVLDPLERTFRHRAARAARRAREHRALEDRPARDPRGVRRGTRRAQQTSSRATRRR